jgi:nucleoside-diphosphate-sugar epimerase
LEALERFARRLRGGPGPDAPHVLITGAGGLVGGILRKSLRDRYELRGLDSHPGRGVDVVADMTDLAAIEGAFEGIDAVVDLAADPNADASWQTVRENNIPATLNALEAARQAGARRFVFASSNHVTGMYEHDEPYASIVAGNYDSVPEAFERIRAASPIRPDGPYGVGKATGEAAARFYADEHGLSAICLRIGTVNQPGRPQNAREFATLLTHRDLVHLVGRCLAAPASVRFAVLYGVSANKWRFWDIEEARHTIGYEPRDDAERWR